MPKGRLNVERDALVRALLLFGFAAAVYVSIHSGSIRHFINPAYLRFTVPSVWVLVALSLVQMAAAVRFLPKGVMRGKGRPGPSTAVYLVFTATLLVGLTLSPVTLGADVVERQGLNLGQRARQGATVLTPGTGLAGTVAWLSSGLEGLTRGGQTGTIRTAQAAANDGETRADPYPGSQDVDPVPGPGSQSPDGELAFDPEQGLELDDSDIVNDRLVITERNFFARVWDFWINPQDYEGKEVELVGFVSRFDEFADDQMMVARLVVVCHVAHAMPDGFVARYNGASGLEDNTWIRVVGTMEMGDMAGFDLLEMKVSELEVVPALDDPYVYPGDLGPEDFEY